MNTFQTSEIQRVIKAGNNENINSEILGVIYSLGRDAQNDEEYTYAFETLLSIYEDASDKVRTYVILAFSLLAVNHGKLDREIVEPIIKKEWESADKRNRATIQDAIDDINFVLKWNLNM